MKECMVELFGNYSISIWSSLHNHGSESALWFYCFPAHVHQRLHNWLQLQIYSKMDLKESDSGIIIYLHIFSKCQFCFQLLLYYIWRLVLLCTHLWVLKSNGKQIIQEEIGTSACHYVIVNHYLFTWTCSAWCIKEILVHPTSPPQKKSGWHGRHRMDRHTWA